MKKRENIKARKEYDCLCCLSSISIGEMYSTTTITHDAHYDWIIEEWTDKTTEIIKFHSDKVVCKRKSELLFEQISDWHLQRVGDTNKGND